MPAFTELGGTPIDKVRYDNLKAALSGVLFVRGRDQSERWVAFRSHLGDGTGYRQPSTARTAARVRMNGGACAPESPTSGVC